MKLESTTLKRMIRKHLVSIPQNSMERGINLGMTTAIKVIENLEDFKKGVK